MTFIELQAALNAYMKRTDPETVANEPVALEMARVVVAGSFFPLESEQVIDALAVVNGAADLPAFFGRAVAVGADYAYVTPRDFARRIADDPGSLLGCYTLAGGKLLTHPSETVLRLQYSARPAPISGSSTNWLSEHYAPVWLHAARAEQYRFIEDQQGADLADAYYQGLIAQLGQQSEASRQAGGAIRMKSR